MTENRIEAPEERAPLTHTEEAMLYYGGDLSPAEKTAYEAHLATCPECEALIERAQRLLPAAERMLAFTPKHTIEEQVARFEQLSKVQQRARRQRWVAWGTALAAALLLVAGLALVLRPKALPEREPNMSPTPSDGR